jgi:hypothetical protein
MTHKAPDMSGGGSAWQRVLASTLYVRGCVLRSDAVEFNDRHASCMRHGRRTARISHGAMENPKRGTRHTLNTSYYFKYTRARGRRRHVPREPPIVDSRVRFYYSKANMLHATHPGSARALARALESSLLEGGAVTGVTSEPSRVDYWGGWGV